MSIQNQTTFILLRGLSRESRHWGRFIAELQANSRTVQTVPIDLPGTGALRRMKAPLLARDNVALLRPRYLNVANPTAKKIIIGISFGGMVAAQWIEKFPHDFDAAVLINTSSNHSPFFRRMKVAGSLQLLVAMFAGDGVSKEKRIADVICNLTDTTTIAEQWAAIRQSAPVSAANTLRQLVAAARFQMPPRTSIPVLLLCGNQDRLVSPQCSADIARIQEYQIISHPEAGHDLTTDAPNWSAVTILNWLERLD